MQPVGQMAEISDRGRELLDGVVEEPLIRGAPADVGRAQVHRQTEEALLGAVVKVSFDAVALGGLSGNDPRA